MAKLPLFASKVFLAPMAGVTDPAFRLLCRELGAGLAFTPLTNIHAVIAKKKEIKDFVEFSAKEKPRAVQLFGSDIKALKQAVKIVSPYFDIIDYNMGCPSPHAAQQAACSALLQKPQLARKIFQTMIKSTNKPITVKMRSGISRPGRFKEIAKIAEEEGISMITLHARTARQGYSGKADWKLIKELKESVDIPVCGNGDINSPEDAKKMLEETGCDYVMVGRAAMRNPFIFAQANEFFKKGKYLQPSARAKIRKFEQYLDEAKDYKTIRLANIRMQAMNFSSGCKGSRKFRGKLLRAESAGEIKKLMEEFYKEA